MHRTQVSKRRLLAFLLCALLAVCPLTTAMALTNDYTGHWAEASMDRAVALGFFQENAEGVYRPDERITRAEFVTMVNRMEGFDGEADLSAYPDVSPDAWYYAAFAAAVDNGYIQGTGDRLNPTAPITRNEVVAIFARITHLDLDADYAEVMRGVMDADMIPDWALPFAGAAIGNGLMVGSDGKFNGGDHITRAETATLLERIYDDVRVFYFPGIYGGEGGLTAATILIIGPDIILQNVTATNIIVDRRVGEGAVTLKNTSVDGVLTINGGSSSVLQECDIAGMVLTKPGTQVALEDGSHVETLLMAGDGAVVDAVAEGVTIGSATFEAPGTINTGEDTVIDKVVMNSPSAVTGDGTVKEAEVNVDGGSFDTAPEKLTLAPGVTTTVDGELVDTDLPKKSTGTGNNNTGNPPAATTWTVTFHVVGEYGTLQASVDGAALSTGASVQAGKSVVFTAVPGPNYKVQAWTKDGLPVEGNTTTGYTATVGADLTVTVAFEKEAVSAEVDYSTTGLVVVLEESGVEYDEAAGKFLLYGEVTSFRFVDIGSAGVTYLASYDGSAWHIAAAPGTTTIVGYYAGSTEDLIGIVFPIVNCIVLGNGNTYVIVTIQK